MSFGFHLTCHCGVLIQNNDLPPQISWLVNLFAADLKPGETGQTRLLFQPTCLGLVLNECRLGPQRVLHCCKGPGIIWIGACAIAICPSPPPLVFPQSLPTAALEFTNAAAHLRGKTLARPQWLLHMRSWEIRVSNCHFATVCTVGQVKYTQLN